MDRQQVLDMLEAYKNGAVSAETLLTQWQKQPFEDLGFAKIDTHRGIRQGAAEVIYGQNKTPEQIVMIAKRMADSGLGDVLITRMPAEAAEKLSLELGFEFHVLPRLGILRRSPEKQLRGNVAVVSGGTADMAVCEEAALTAEVLGSRVTRIYDVGVAGLHRLLFRLDELLKARVIVAVAGMEGALPSVVGGLVACPVIAVPTSVGYGANLGGVSALLSMLNSCASGVSVVNIDNGFGAGYLASRINLMEGIR